MMKPIFCSLLLLSSVAASVAAPAYERVSTQINTRFVITQSTPTDCGPAALATLLRYHLGVDTTRKEMMSLTRFNAEAGTSLLGLEEAARAKKCIADSFRMSYGSLQQQLALSRTPVIVRTLNPTPHFSVVLAIVRDRVYVSDPGLGNRSFTKSTFLKLWELPASREGFVFVVDAPGRRANAWRAAQIVEELQGELQGGRSRRTPPQRHAPQSRARRQ